MLKFGVLAMFLCLSFCSCAVSDPGRGPLQVDFGDELSQEFRDILFQASSLELVSINPAWPTKETRADPANLHGYTVRGRTRVESREVRLELLKALGKGARENNGMVAACFNPRHVLVGEFEGRTCEVIICFECLTFQVWNGTEKVESVDLSQSPRKTFDRIFTEAGLSIAPGS
jgi:hypothetical protein